MSGIFLSYRRDDASGWAGRLYEHLVREWGRDQVFMDIDTIVPGEDFREAIARTMETCDIVMIVIGPKWVDARDLAGRRRLEDENDTHRAEVVAALAADVRVIPVLVGGATMPQLSDLPGPMRDLAYRNAAVVEDRRFASDVEALQNTLRKLIGPGASSQPPRQPDGRGDGDFRGGSGARATSRSSPSSSVVEAGSGELRDHPAPRAGLASAPLPLTLAILGLAMVLIWGVLVPRSWHNEFWGIRVLAGVLLVAGASAGVWSRRWIWVLVAGAAGLAGLSLWMLQLISTHSDEIGELASPAADGIPNGASFVGAVLVLVAGSIGTKGRYSAPPS
jgi:hypothetical protein